MSWEELLMKRIEDNQKRMVEMNKKLRDLAAMVGDGRQERQQPSFFVVDVHCEPDDGDVHGERDAADVHGEGAARMQFQSTATLQQPSNSANADEPCEEIEACQWVGGRTVL
ncbi:hypothetical protein VIGAN_03187900 [Vigna angularis var. angularis]|uniref:Uncharacterized protein n=1 Tax=Vigna angularis var. angularis TaxID=157739 RepID=A0A0S3RMY9_PHAAN|nr:hypothetical protein VIGAN_03187900 [Vigna angularis var. angularis]